MVSCRRHVGGGKMPIPGESHVEEKSRQPEPPSPSPKLLNPRIKPRRMPSLKSSAPLEADAPVLADAEKGMV